MSAPTRLRPTAIALLTLLGLAACGTRPPAATATSSAPAALPAAPEPVSAATPPLQRQPLAADLVEMAYSARQRALFVAAPDWEDENRSQVLRLDPATLAVQARIPLQGKGLGVALDDAAGRLYLTQGFNGAIAVVDTVANRVIQRIPVMEKVNFAQAYAERGLSEQRRAFLLEQLGKFKVSDDYPYKIREMVVDTRHHRLFAPGLGLGFDSVLFVIDTRTLTLEQVLPGFGYNAVGIALDADGGRVFVSNMQGQIITVDAGTLAITATHEVEADQLLNLAYDPQGRRLFGVDQGIDRDAWRNNHLERAYAHRSAGHRVFVFDADSGRTLANLPTGEVPIGLAFDAQAQRLYVANRGGVRVEQGHGTLSAYDTQHYAWLQTLALPPHPNSVVLEQPGRGVFVTVKNDGAGKKAGQPESVVRIEGPWPR
ncbi:MAG: hypothetical protein QM617_15830 [Comamonas sp.]